MKRPPHVQQNFAKIPVLTEFSGDDVRELDDQPPGSPGAESFVAPSDFASESDDRIEENEEEEELQEAEVLEDEEKTETASLSGMSDLSGLSDLNVDLSSDDEKGVGLDDESVGNKKAKKRKRRGGRQLVRKQPKLGEPALTSKEVNFIHHATKQLICSIL